MIPRSIAFGLAFIAVCLMVSAVQAKAKEKALHGTVVSISASTLIVNVKADKNDKLGIEKTFGVSPNVSVMVDGQPGKLDNIKQNDKIGFKVDADGKLVTDIAKGHQPKKAA